MKKTILYSLFIIPIYSCGPCLEEKKFIEQAKLDSITLERERLNEIEKNDSSEPISSNQNSYYLASDFGLIPGEVVTFAPDNETVSEMKCAGGENPDTQIFIQIKEASGKITVLPCDYKTWLNLSEGAILK